MSRHQWHAPSTSASAPCPAAPPTANHDSLRLALMDAGRQVRAAADDLARLPAARDDLVRFCRTELLPHLEADEGWLIEAQHCPELRLLAQTIRAEARSMAAAAHGLTAATGPCEAVAATRVLHALLAAHAQHEELLLTTWSRLSAGHAEP